MNPSPASSRSSRRESFAWAAAAFFVVTTVTTAMLAARQAKEAARTAITARSRIDAPSGAAFRAGGLAISGDGRYLAAALEEPGGSSRLWVRPLDALAWHALAGSEGARSPFWSPDDSEIGFFCGGALRRIRREGGPVSALAAAAAPLGGTWSRRGVVLFAPAEIGGLAAIPGSGGQAALVTHAPDGFSHRAPWFLPDGTHFVYLAVRGGTARLRVGSLDGRDDRDLAPGTGPAAYLGGFLVHPAPAGLVCTPFHEGQRVVAGADRLAAGPVRSDFARFDSAFSVSGAGVLVYVPASGDGTFAVLVTHWDPDAEPR